MLSIALTLALVSGPAFSKPAQGYLPGLSNFAYGCALALVFWSAYELGIATRLHAHSTGGNGGSTEAEHLEVRVELADQVIVYYNEAAVHYLRARNLVMGTVLMGITGVALSSYSARRLKYIRDHSQVASIVNIPPDIQIRINGELCENEYGLAYYSYLDGEPNLFEALDEDGNVLSQVPFKMVNGNGLKTDYRAFVKRR